MLSFHDDALLLSGPLGSGLKTRILEKYYRFWWRITSGGAAHEYSNPTAIVDMNAGTGELFIEATGETILGSSGHALQLKCVSDYPTAALKVVLVEHDQACFSRLQNVIRRRWPDLPLDESMGPIERNSCGVYLANLDLNEALEAIWRISPGNSIFFFDPLLHVEWETVERVAESRIRYPLQTGTEFIIFLFTSDWFTGREYSWREELVALPTSPNRGSWTLGQAETAHDADGLFGDGEWREQVLCRLDRASRQEAFIEEYRKRLLSWFRWVLPMPFVPKTGQLYHLILCSNYDAGVNVTRSFYCDFTGSPRYEPDNVGTYRRFSRLHPETLAGIRGLHRPVEWKVLWQIIRNCEAGICDARCAGIREQGTPGETAEALAWLVERHYLEPLEVRPRWVQPLPRYQLNWDLVRSNLRVAKPPKLEPITPDTFQREHGIAP